MSNLARPFRLLRVPFQAGGGMDVTANADGSVHLRIVVNAVETTVSISPTTWAEMRRLSDEASGV